MGVQFEEELVTENNSSPIHDILGKVSPTELQLRSLCHVSMVSASNCIPVTCRIVRKDTSGTVTADTVIGMDAHKSNKPPRKEDLSCQMEYLVLFYYSDAWLHNAGARASFLIGH
ncbi:hypothetical protein TNCV_4364391 [Trichonephila clavipes]|nr:hypothetical protein TNCV_4364391 [Trichonephila clavipes]